MPTTTTPTMSTTTPSPLGQRRAKSGGIFGSLIGMLIGLVLVIAVSPYLLWKAHSQYRASDFQTATVVSADGNDQGYIVIEGNATNVDALKCPKIGDVKKALPANRSVSPTPTSTQPTETQPTVAEPIVAVQAQNCVYVTSVKEVYTMSEVEQCGSIESNQKVIRQVADQCDENGENCESCYMVEQYDWKAGDTQYQTANFKVGAYTIKPSEVSNVIGIGEFTDYVYEISKTAPAIGDERYNFTYLPADQTLLVAGEARNQQIMGSPGREPFVISNKTYDATLTDLKAQDRAAGWMFRIFSLLAMMLGMLLIVGPLTLLSNFMRFIPVVGKHADKGFDGLVKFFAIVVGIALWLVIYAIVILLKNIWIALILLAVIGVIVFLIVSKGKKQKS